MSAWDRSRHIPWSRVKQPTSASSTAGGGTSTTVSSDDDYEAQKEQVMTEIRNTNNDNDGTHTHTHTNTNTNNNTTTTNTTTSSSSSLLQKRVTKAISDSKTNTAIPFSYMELAKQAVFGACIGTITGAVFGFMDGMRSAGESQVLQKASSSAKLKYVLEGSSRSGAIFGAFFGGFHMVKYGFRVGWNPGEYSEIGLAGMLSLGAMVIQPATRPAIPYAAMLIIMDGANIMMRDMKKE